MVEKNSILANRLSQLEQSYKSIFLGIFNYKDTKDYLINISLFPKSKNKVTLDDIGNTLTEITNIESNFLSFEKEIKNSLLSQKQIYFFIRNIKHRLQYCQLLKNAVYIEAEKGGYMLDHQSKRQLLQSINTLENKIYGISISDTPEEKSAVLKYFGSLFEKKGNLLSINEQKIFSNFLKKFNISKKPGISKNKKKQEILLYNSDAIWEVFSRAYEIYNKKSCKVYIQKKIKEGYYNNGICYIPAFWRDKQKNNFYKKYNLLSHIKICFSDVVSSVSVGLSWVSGSHSIVFPSGISYSWKRICELLDHEVATHFVRNENAFNGCSVKSAGYLSTEEGIATINEDMVSIIEFDKLTKREPTLHHLATFIAEQYNYSQTLELLKIYFLMSGFSQSDALSKATSRTIRVKRFHSFDLPGANRKDTSYWRGNLNIYNWYKSSGWDVSGTIRSLYAGKFSLEDIDIISSDDFGHHNFTPPIFIGKLLYQLSQGRRLEEIVKLDKRLSGWGFVYGSKEERSIKKIIEKIKNYAHK